MRGFHSLGTLVSSPQFLYRTAVEEDAWEMVGVHYASVRSIGTEHYSDAILLAWSPPPDEGRRQWLARLITQESVLCTAAVSSENKIGGFCIALPAQAQLKALYVHPDFARHGLGQGLLQNIEARCRALGLEALELNSSYNAEMFYRRCGYVSLGPTSHALNESIAMRAVRMIKRFPEVV